jgi:hypothetical protein
MDEKAQARILTANHAGMLLILVVVAKVVIEQLIHRRAILNPNVVDALEWVPFVLGLSAIVLVLVIIRGWTATTRYARREKVLIGLYLVGYVVGGIARRIGLPDWLEGLSQPWEAIIYAATTLLMSVLVARMVVMAVKDMEERTTREVRAKLRHRAGEADHSPPLKTSV